MTTMTVTLELDAEHITALEAEATDHAQTLEVYLSGVLRRRVERPGWPERAEAAELAARLEQAHGELDRARDTAVRHEGEAHHLQEQLDNALTASTVHITVEGLSGVETANAVLRYLAQVAGL